MKHPFSQAATAGSVVGTFDGSRLDLQIGQDVVAETRLQNTLLTADASGEPYVGALRLGGTARVSVEAGRCGTVTVVVPVLVSASMPTVWWPPL